MTKSERRSRRRSRIESARYQRRAITHHKLMMWEGYGFDWVVPGGDGRYPDAAPHRRDEKEILETMEAVSAHTRDLPPDVDSEIREFRDGAD